jgi:hypothetical protein
MIFADVRLPGAMGGVDLAWEVKLRWPLLPTILTSGIRSSASANFRPVSLKRMALLKEVAPQLRRVAMLWNANDLGMTLRYRASEAVAEALGISVQPLGVREPDDFDQARHAGCNSHGYRFTH